MTTDIELYELFYTDTQIFFKILNLLRNSYDRELTQYLIYSDDNYLNYLKKKSLDENVIKATVSIVQYFPNI